MALQDSDRKASIPTVCPLKITKDDNHQIYVAYAGRCSKGLVECHCKNYLACPRFSKWYWEEVTSNAGARP